MNFRGGIDICYLWELMKIRPCQTKSLFHLVSHLPFGAVEHLRHRADEI